MSRGKIEIRVRHSHLRFVSPSRSRVRSRIGPCSARTKVSGERHAFGYPSFRSTISIGIYRLLLPTQIPAAKVQDFRDEARSLVHSPYGVHQLPSLQAL